VLKCIHCISGNRLWLPSTCTPLYGCATSQELHVCGSNETSSEQQLNKGTREERACKCLQDLYAPRVSKLSLTPACLPKSQSTP
jgi:hypothetical protein